MIDLTLVKEYVAPNVFNVDPEVETDEEQQEACTGRTPQCGGNKPYQIMVP